MENSTYARRLRYVDADDLTDDVVDYESLDVLGPDGERIGDLDGFIVDPEAGRVYHLVVDSGGWFRSRQFLLPVGHARLDTGRRALVADITKAALSRYPEFHHDRFREFTDDEFRAFERRTAVPPSRDVYQREHVTARAGEPDDSPHHDGRAQPGDVLGIETGGETTAIGDTMEDENKRRREAERAVRDRDEPRRSER